MGVSRLSSAKDPIIWVGANDLQEPFSSCACLILKCVFASCSMSRLLNVFCFMLWLVTKFLEKLQCLYFSIYILFFCIWLGPWGLYMEEKSLLFVSMSHLLKSMHLCILKKVRLSWPCLVSSNELNFLKIICITVAFEYSTWPFSI
jgi:hypothetical protein